MKSESSFYVSADKKYSAYKREEDLLFIVSIVRYSVEDVDIEISRGAADVKRANNVKIHSIAKEIDGFTANDNGSFLLISFPDFLNRTAILRLVNSLINEQRAKGVLLATQSLSLCLGLSIQNACVINRSSDVVVIGGIEDNCTVGEKVVVGEVSLPYSLDEEDFSEDFSKKQEDLLKRDEVPPIIFQCPNCKEKRELESVIDHIVTDHKEVPEDIDKFIERIKEVKRKEEPRHKAGTVAEGVSEFVGRMGTEKIKKMFSNVICVLGEKAEDVAEAVRREFGEASAVIEMSEEERNEKVLRGLHALSNLEISKELWLTDKEWNSVGLRVLKEKVLFSL